ERRRLQQEWWKHCTIWRCSMDNHKPRVWNPGVLCRSTTRQVRLRSLSKCKVSRDVRGEKVMTHSLPRFSPGTAPLAAPPRNNGRRASLSKKENKWGSADECHLSQDACIPLPSVRS